MPEGVPGSASKNHTVWCPLGNWNFDTTNDEELHFYQSPIHLMEVAGEELNNQQAVLGAEAHVPAPKIDDSVEHTDHESTIHVRVASNPIMSMEHAVMRIKDKGKEKVDEIMKEPVYIGGVSLVDLDDIEVSDKDLMMDTSESDDVVSPNPDGVGVGDGLGSSSQAMDSNIESASKLVAPEIAVHPEPRTTSTASIDNPLFNVAG